MERARKIRDTNVESGDVEWCEDCGKELCEGSYVDTKGYIHNSCKNCVAKLKLIPCPEDSHLCEICEERIAVIFNEKRRVWICDKCFVV